MEVGTTPGSLSAFLLMELTLQITTVTQVRQGPAAWADRCPLTEKFHRTLGENEGMCKNDVIFL